MRSRPGGSGGAGGAAVHSAHGQVPVPPTCCWRGAGQFPGGQTAACVRRGSHADVKTVPVVVLVADGARVDAFEGPLDDLPALRRLRDEGGAHTVTSVFPSVTGPAYTPF